MKPRALLSRAVRSLAGAIALCAVALHTAEAQDVWVVQVVGLGGNDHYTERFTGWADEIRTHLVERWGVEGERIVTLGEEDAPGRIDGVSRRETIEATVERLTRETGPADRILFVLIGHGSFRDGVASLNLPGRDLTAAEWNDLLAPLSDRTLALVNLASSSGPFVQALAAEGRTVITATRSGQERNETQFGRYFVEALGGGASDLDKDGRLSLFEAYIYARSETSRYYDEAGLLATEHAQLDDDGDGEAIDLPLEDTADGRAAAAFRFAPRGARTTVATVTDSVATRIEAEIAEIEARLAALRAERSTMSQEAYDLELEGLLVELALKNREFRARTGGGR
ncbi:MAG: hypothetical protein RQ745_06455 [Longimicrobiales bacterium]|nr:hypothetical protein [Longimicrobiales bacterium]